MLKARNIIIIFVVNYILMLLVSGIIEMTVLTDKAKTVQMNIRTAADMALEQSQVIDDFLAYDNRESYKLLMPSSNGTGFINTDLFGGVFNLDSQVNNNHEEIFNRLYDNNDLKMLSMRTGALRTPIKYWNYERTNFTWYYLPKVSMLGLDILPSGNATTGIKDMMGNYVPEAFAQEIIQAYGLQSHVKTTGGENYYNTPLNFGVTYLNEELLGTLFMNNMDLMMRLKYEENLNTEAGGHGVLKGSTYADRVTSDLSEYNPINNGIYTLLRGQKNDSDPDVESYSGVKPLVVYRVIDMYDSANDQMLVHLFGAKKDGFSTKAEYLKSLDNDILNPVTNAPYTSKPVVVAKVTFYADIAVPYFTLVMRDLRGALGLEEHNLIEVLPESPGGEAGMRRMAYTRYFAVTP